MVLIILQYLVVGILLVTFHQWSVTVLQVKRSRSKGGLAGPDGMKSVFGQICTKMSLFGPDSLMLPHRVWKVKFIGEPHFSHSTTSFHVTKYFKVLQLTSTSCLSKVKFINELEPISVCLCESVLYIKC